MVTNILIIFILISSCISSSFATSDIDYQLPDLSNRSTAVQDLLQTGYTELIETPSSAKWSELGLMLMANSFHDNALIVLGKTIQIKPNNPKVQTALAYLYKKESKLTLAIQHLKNARKTTKNITNIQLTLLEAEIQEELGLYQKALQLYQDAHKKINKKDRVVTNLALGRTLLNLGRYQESKSHLLKAAKQLPASADIRATLLKLSAFIPIDENKIPAISIAINTTPVNLASPYLEDIFEQYSRDEESLHFHFFNLFINKKNIVKAGKTMDILYQYYPKTLNETELIDYAFILSGRQENKKAKKIYKETTQRFPSSAEAYLGLATLNFLYQELNQAKKNYQKALRIHPTNNVVMSRIYQGLGRLAATQKKLKKSITLLQKSSTFQPNSGEIHFDLANVYAEDKKFKNAWEQINLAEHKGFKVNTDFRKKLQYVEELHHKTKSVLK